MGGMELQDALQVFLVQLAADGRSEHTRHQYRRHVRLLATWLADTGRSGVIDTITHESLAVFLTSDLATNRPDGKRKRATSVNALRTSLRVFFGFTEAAGIVNTSPARLIRRARCSPPPPRVLGDDDVQRLLDVLDAAEGPCAERDRVLIRLLLGTGLRLGSALALRTDDIDLARAELHIHKAKGDVPIVLPMRADVATVLATHMSARPLGRPVFPGAGDRPLTTRQAARRIAQWAHKAELAGKMSAHVLRHVFAARLYAQTGDLLLVQKALGHRSVVSTQVYVQADIERLRAALAG